MLTEKEIDALSVCVGSATGEFGTSETIDLATQALAKLRATQQGVHPTVRNVREIEVICPNCSLVIDVPVPESHSG